MTAASLLRQYGLRGVLKKALLDPLGRVVRVNRVLFYETSAVDRAPTAGVRLERGDAGTIARLIASGLVRTSADAVNRRLGEGHECILLYADSDEPRGYGWIAHRSLHEDGIDMTIPLQSQEIFLYDFRIAPARRGLGLYPRMLRGMVALAGASRGRVTAYIATHAENRASRRGIEKAGFSLAFEVSYRRVGPVRRRRYTRRGGGAGLLEAMKAANQ